MSSTPLSFIATLDTLDLYVGADDEWLAQKGHHECDAAGLRTRASLLWLPLLEQDYPTFRNTIFTGLSSLGPEKTVRCWATFPVQALVALGLTMGGSLYWVDLALSWSTHIKPEPEVLAHVRALALNKSIPQATRHRAKRLYYTGKA